MDSSGHDNMNKSAHTTKPAVGPGLIATLVTAGVLGLGAVWLGTGVVGADSWPVQWLEVEGELARTSEEQVRSAVSVHAGVGFFAVDLHAVRRSVAALPWIASAQVRRRWPDTLVIAVDEHKAVARWNDGLLNRRGEAFSVPGADQLQGLPWLEGPPARLGEVLELWVALHHELATINIGIERLRVDERGAWSLALSNGTVLRLGRDHALERVRRYVAVADELHNLHEYAPALVDLRHTNGLAVRWPDVSDRRHLEEHG